MKHRRPVERAKKGLSCHQTYRLRWRRQWQCLRTKNKQITHTHTLKHAHTHTHCVHACVCACCCCWCVRACCCWCVCVCARTHVCEYYRWSCLMAQNKNYIWHTIPWYRCQSMTITQSYRSRNSCWEGWPSTDLFKKTACIDTDR